MDSSGSQQNASGNAGGNVITLNNNDLIQQRTSLGNGQQVFYKWKIKLKKYQIDISFKFIPYFFRE